MLCRLFACINWHKLAEQPTPEPCLITSVSQEDGWLAVVVQGDEEPESLRGSDKEEEEDAALAKMEEGELFTHMNMLDYKENICKIELFMKIVTAKVVRGKYKSAKHSVILGNNLEHHVLPILKHMQSEYLFSAALGSLIDRLERFNQLPMVYPFLGVIAKSSQDLTEIHEMIFADEGYILGLI